MSVGLPEQLAENATEGEIQNWQAIMTSLLTNRVIGRERTTDATKTALIQLQPASEQTTFAKIWVWARRTGGLAGSANDAAGYLIYSAWTVKSGTTTLLGATHTPSFTHEDQAAWQAEVEISANRPVVNVTGSVNMDITWLGTIRLFEAAT